MVFVMISRHIFVPSLPGSNCSYFRRFVGLVLIIFECSYVI